MRFCLSLVASAALIGAVGFPQRQAVQATPPPLFNGGSSLTPTPPQVIIMVADDLGWSELGSPVAPLGPWPLMPNLRALAAQGTTFTQAHSNPTCSPSRYCLQFGRWARRQPTVALDLSGALVPMPGGIGDLAFNAHVPTQERIPLVPVCLAEGLPAYTTYLVGKWHLGRAPLLGQMDQDDSAPYAQGMIWRAGNPTILSAGPGARGYRKWQRVEEGEMQIETRWATDVQRDALLDLLSEPLPLPLPRLIVQCWSAPHDPWDTPPGMFPALTTRRAYELVVQDLDDAIGDVLASVDLSTTYVIFVSDNGTPDNAAPVAGTSGRWKGSLYQGGINVPLVVVGPGVTAAAVSSRVVSLVDIAATVAEIAGQTLPPAAFDDSRSFANALGASWTGTPEREFTMSERYEVAGGPSYPQPAGFDGIAIVERMTFIDGVPARLKLLRQDADGNGPGPSADVVYDLAADPAEQHPFDPAALPADIRGRLYDELASLPPRAP